ncbi:RadC family protein [Legionella jordanis]|uniref:DNA repair protein RadC n=1 Tax=Legionella jordanis TaxID=456 RepID=A0A0W0VBF4_9GAMM|nr:DNA repair protein RadC [Legionella jordanis]KTD17416.1 DNA repair protein RadC [Legionella jordanis]RMX01819.1 DNA repair protein RadC [Legionella jordanis]RMX15483.1 DNA repair protein RadC [Legionella jordanis]VEH11563.1 DNA repair protein RadC [Legionella jordanis]HAT8714637.1 DNA repair protein RadC [Legionella jordanis]
MTKSSSAPALDVREKLLRQGPGSLSDVELLAVLISCGSGKKSCLQLAIELLKHLGDLRSILNCDFKRFRQVRGLGLVRYAQLQAVREICRRSDFIGLQRETQLQNSRQTHLYLKRQLRDKKNETFAALFLDSQNRILAYEELFAGTINLATVYTRPLIERILQLNAAAIILAHNHPSGLSDASPQDVEVTKRMREALELIDAKLLDHLVIGDNEVYSIAHGVKWPCH